MEQMSFSTYYFVLIIYQSHNSLIFIKSFFLIDVFRLSLKLNISIQIAQLIFSCIEALLYSLIIPENDTQERFFIKISEFYNLNALVKAQFFYKIKALVYKLLL